jgi:hypothetical protein
VVAVAENLVLQPLVHAAQSLFDQPFATELLPAISVSKSVSDGVVVRAAGDAAWAAESMLSAPPPWTARC